MMRCRGARCAGSRRKDARRIFAHYAAKAFDDFAGTKPDKEQLHRILGNSPAKAAKQ